MRFDIRTLARTISALALGAVLLAGMSLSALAHGGHGKGHNRGRHLGWTIGRHRGWDRNHRDNDNFRIGRRLLKRHERTERRDLREHQHSERDALRDTLTGGHRGGAMRGLSEHQRDERQALRTHERGERQVFKQGRGKH
ncbi:MAG: hypothetical protein LC754_18270 [Acidobacteria bacterium]|nr:hypothetical protein [Acidobacteriota bacterium]